MKPDKLVFHGRYAICCSCAGPIFQEATLYTSRHIFRVFDSPFFISGTLFLAPMFGMGRTKVSWAVRYWRSSRTLIGARVGEWPLVTNIVEQESCELRLQGFSEVHSIPVCSQLVLRLACHTGPFAGLGEIVPTHYPSHAEPCR